MVPKRKFSFVIMYLSTLWTVLFIFCILTVETDGGKIKVNTGKSNTVTKMDATQTQILDALIGVKDAQTRLATLQTQVLNALT